ncbi:hypothetical protein NQ176_g8770 [Zarea fungicola]|uniref:Uncharacterized protein n=1 Tax=Zarea fungicola TaxID=93591 RepID=A0ACC1MQJ1_9HYPO|nr:hypothetical protein NQ176_g8770 [Lecanicillium fungicola]
MEVFLRGVPKDLSDTSLLHELAPHMSRLGITDYSCDKPKKKPQAWLTFLKAEDGSKFLAKHGKVPAPAQSRAAAAKGPPHRRPGSDIARLHILQSAVYVQQSNKAPDHLILSHLRLESDQRHARPAKKPVVATSTACRVRGISCGKMVFSQSSDKSLVFARQTECTTSGQAEFKRKSCIYTSATGNQMHISYTTIEDLVFDSSDKSFTMILNQTPRFYSLNTVEIDPRTKWSRMPVLAGWPELSKYVSHCLVYRFQVGNDDFNRFFSAVKAKDIVSVHLQNIRVDTAPRLHLHDYTSCMQDFTRKIGHMGNNTRLLGFEILFQVQKLVWNNYLHPKTATTVLEIMDRLAMEAEMENQPCPFSAQAMKQLFNQIPYPTPGVEPTQLDAFELLSTVVAAEAQLHRTDPLRNGRYNELLPAQQAWVLKALVTPTRVILSGPDAESKNRVLRMFPDRTDYFLRVTFTDEDGMDLGYNPRVSNDYVYDHYRSVMKQGIEIAGRRFSFLGFSHSSLRSHSTWFMAPFTDNRMGRQDYATVLSSLGDFKKIRIPAKCAARIGQAFSETPFAVSLRENGITINYIDDVKSRIDPSRVFSDGVGTMSQGALEEFWAVLPLQLGSPTCIQIRLGGVKGMLSLDPRLEGKEICIRRESMMKFPSKDVTEIGICETAAKPLRLVLNRQMIKILEDMGTNPSWFKKLQAKALAVLRGVTATASNTCTFLEYQGVGTSVGLPRLIRRLDRHGLDYRHDPFLKAVVEYVVLRELRLLKHKARIPVEKGVTLFGVMDETGFLKEGEVYIHYDARQPGRQDGIDGSLKDGCVIVTRSPALHPGDIQAAKMVTPPAKHPLRALRNCIVFSQRGDRDLPSQLSGGDLDGDKYNIFWDPEGFPTSVFSPASYPRTLPEPLERDVTRDDIANFFIEFMKADILGLIANRHVIYADIQPLGTEDPICVKLAGLHSTAVDYSKTGIPPDVVEIPRQPKTRPDFTAPAPPVDAIDLGQIAFVDVDEEEDEGDDGFGRPRYRYHRSEKILGELYRAIDEKSLWAQMAGKVGKNYSLWEQVQKLMEIELAALGIRLEWSSRVEFAQTLRNCYEEALLNNMTQFSSNPRVPVTETEAFCGDVVNKTGSQSRQQRDLSTKLKDEMDRLMNWIAWLIRNPEDKTGGPESQILAHTLQGGAPTSSRLPSSGRLNALEMSVACFQISMQRKPAPAFPGRREKSDGLQSFRVIAAACMLNELETVARDLRGMATATTLELRTKNKGPM